VRLVSGSDDNTVILWNLNSYEISGVKLTGHQKPISYLSFSPDTKWFISASFDHTIKIRYQLRQLQNFVDRIITL